MDFFHEVDDPLLTSPNHIGQSTASNTSTNSQNNEESTSKVLRNETSATSCSHGPEGDKVTGTQDHNNLVMRSFMDLRLTPNMLGRSRRSFGRISNEWRSSLRVVHPPFGHFKFSYSPNGMLDFATCVEEEVGMQIIQQTSVNYPRPSLTWLHVIPDVTIKDRERENEREDSAIHKADAQIIQSDTTSFIETSETTSASSNSTSITRSEISEPVQKTLYIPPHQRVNTNTSHFRSQSESVIQDSKNTSSSRVHKNTRQSIHFPTFAGNTHALHSHLQNLPTTSNFSSNAIIQNNHNNFELSDQRNYRGTGQGAKSIKNLQDHLNCSVFVSHLPKDVQHHEIFNVINTGSVVSLHIMRPVSWNPFCAAKIVFKYPEGAARFIAASCNAEKIQIREHQLHVRYNHHGMVKHSRENQSRVLHIEGPENIMNEGFWTAYFDKITKYTLEYVGYLQVPNLSKGMRVMEFRFARVEAQAQSILIDIVHDDLLSEMVCIWYGEDPCGKGWEF